MVSAALARAADNVVRRPVGLLARHVSPKLNKNNRMMTNLPLNGAIKIQRQNLEISLLRI
jgi:hypothetical protein